MYVDSHCHLDKITRSQQDGVARVMSDARAAGVEHVLCVGVTLADYPHMRRAVADVPDVSFSCGLHPLYLAEQPLDQQLLHQICQDNEVVAVGETGLDYYYDQASQDKQQRSFAEHIDVAVDLHKPLIIHTRDAREDTISALRHGGAERCRGVLHCFTETREMAEQALDLGFYISISGIVTFRSAQALREVVQALPLERLLIETDSPWLAPVPHRGKENEPAFVPEVARCIADLKGVSVAEVAAVTRQNFYDLFPLAAAQDAA